MKKFQPTLLSLALSLAFAGVAQAESPMAKSTPQLLEKGKAAFQINCATCHGEKGAGDGIAAAALNPKPRNFIKDKFKNGDKPQQVFDSITKGLPGTSMAPFGHLSEEDRWGLTHHILALRKGGK